MVDFHTHILPGIDDGSPNIETTLKMLELQKKQGIEKVVATPHFYLSSESVRSFLHRRNKAVRKLIDEGKPDESTPKIALGAEVLLFPEIAGLADLEELCILGTKYILVEMPFFKWTGMTYETLEKIRRRGFIPIIAHFERYLPIQKDKKMVENLIGCGCMIQANADFFCGTFSKRKGIRLLKKELIHLIGSDCHNLDTRKPNMDMALDYIKKRLGSPCLEDLEALSEMVLSNANYIC